MNDRIKMLGLRTTHFVEPSGLSGNNITTAREFADFSLVYIREYPLSLRAFHSVTRFEYPMPWNLPAGTTAKPVVQSSTNKLLGVLPGCDGLKTGYIDESGYNLALTAERNGTRFISVTLGGPGKGSREGNEFRSADGLNLMNWAFANFRTVKPKAVQPVSIPVWGGLQDNIQLIPALPSAFTAPVSLLPSGTAASSDKNLKTEIVFPRWLTAPVSAGTVFGKVIWSVNGTVIHTVPLIADRNVEKGSVFRLMLDGAARLVAPLLRAGRPANR
jgi:D-alanyl-D-alanine carboxypeptidase (penicillin-binding protein 5/6)